MTRDTDASAAAHRDLQVERYVLALDRGDFDAVAAILAEAEADPELDRVLVEVDEALHAEARLTTRADDARTVRQLLMRHLPSAFAEPEAGPPTVGEVAVRLQAEHDAGEQPLLPADLVANRTLMADRTPLDRPMTGQYIREVAHTLAVQATDRYWELFRRAAIALVIARKSRGSILAAARDRAPESQAASQGPEADPPPGAEQP